MSRDGQKSNQKMYTVPTNHKANITEVSAKGLCSQDKGSVECIFLGPVIGDFFRIAHPIYRLFG